MFFMRTTCEVLQKALQTIKIAVLSVIYKASCSLMGFILIDTAVPYWQISVGSLCYFLDAYK